MIRISVGLEHIDDIIRDFEQSFEASSATKSGGNPENAEAQGNTKVEGAISGAT